MRNIIDKPSLCEEKWDKMIPGPGGRTCLGCDKFIIDFRNSSWSKIEKTHQDNPLPVCGIYSNEQLDLWGQEPFSFRRKRLQKFSATFIAIWHLLSFETEAQVKLTPQEPPVVKQSSEKSELNKPEMHILKGTIKQIDGENEAIPLSGAMIQIHEGSIVYSAHSNNSGKFSIEISKEISNQNETYLIWVSHPSLSSAEHFIVNKNELEPLEFILKYEVKYNDVKMEMKSGIRGFYIRNPEIKDSSFLKQDTLYHKVRRRLR